MVRLRLLAFALVASSAVSPVLAGSDDEIKLGALDSYASEADAARHCQEDGVVWADSKTGFLYPRFMEQYGKTATGAFACYKQAKKADYWGFGAIDSMGLKGKSFPFDRCTSCF